MSEQKDTGKPIGICVPNTEQFDLDSASGATYRIFVSWPLGWKSKTPEPDKVKPVKILYVTDGNANFFTAIETVRRHVHFPINKSADDIIVVGIGYELANPEFFYDARRSRDLTSKPSKPPISEESLGRPGEDYGGADNFLDFIQSKVKPFVKNEVFRSLNISQEILFGHSYGGLFALHTLFIRPEMFDIYIAASPSIWWYDQWIKEEEKDFQAKGGAKDKHLRMFYGSWEQIPINHPRESDEEFEKRKNDLRKCAMGINAEEMYERLLKSELLKSVSLKVYPDEDHGSVIGCSIEGAIASLFRDK